MILAHVTFGPRGRNEPGPLKDAAEAYLASLLRSGQICGEYYVAWTKGRLNARVMLAGRGAFQLRYHSPFGKQTLEKIVSLFGAKPAWRMLDDSAGQRPPTWKGAPYLCLFTHALDSDSPVCRGDGGTPIPTFLLPVGFEVKDELHAWQRSYYHHDNIWLDSGALEMAAYRQLADPDSQLARQGRALCRAIEAATQTPAFYFLMRYWGRAKGEADRLCPGCGGSWNCARPPERAEGFWRFEFKCEPCRLVSHPGASTGSSRNTRIGEFHTPAKAPRRSPNLRRGPASGTSYEPRPGT